MQGGWEGRRTAKMLRIPDSLSWTSHGPAPYTMVIMSWMSYSVDCLGSLYILLSASQASTCCSLASGVMKPRLSSILGMLFDGSLEVSSRISHMRSSAWACRPSVSSSFTSLAALSAASIIARSWSSPMFDIVEGCSSSIALLAWVVRVPRKPRSRLNAGGSAFVHVL